MSYHRGIIFSGNFPKSTHSNFSFPFFCFQRKNQFFLRPAFCDALLEQIFLATEYFSDQGYLLAHQVTTCWVQAKIFLQGEVPERY